MKRLIADLVLTVVICAALLLLFQLFAAKTGFFIPLENRTAYKLIQSFIITSCILIVGYKRFWSRATFVNFFKVVRFFGFYLFIFFIVYHSVSIHKNILAYYRYFNSTDFISWKGKMYERDSLLGYKMRPDNLSSLVYNLKQAIDVKTDQHGFRIAHEGEQLSNADNPIELLFLGCSFTFGSACKAEDTFPYLVAQKSGMNYANAGVGGYGLAQMLIQARQFIPKFKPKYVIVQRSPWLIGRSVTEFAPSRGGYLLPTPFFVEEKKQFRVESPVYQSTINKLFPEDDRNAYKGKLLRYYFMKGLAYFGEQQLEIIKTRVNNILGYKKRPTDNVQEAELFAYAEIMKLAKKHNAKIILVHLNNGPITYRKNLSITGYLYSIANADSALQQITGSTSEQTYTKAFGHWAIKGKDSVFVDGHPNPLAHQLIATSILMHLSQK
ncbi:MAG: SGNH/GDSL hydrolase family protein [Lacibacter sp.]|nr:SGNH/GDSL hydrolase family protein [Lacibacter sp.]